MPNPRVCPARRHTVPILITGTEWLFLRATYQLLHLDRCFLCKKQRGLARPGRHEGTALFLQHDVSGAAPFSCVNSYSRVCLEWVNLTHESRVQRAQRSRGQSGVLVLPVSQMAISSSSNSSCWALSLAPRRRTSLAASSPPRSFSCTRRRALGLSKPSLPSSIPEAITVTFILSWRLGSIMTPNISSESGSPHAPRSSRPRPCPGVRGRGRRSRSTTTPAAPSIEDSRSGLENRVSRGLYGAVVPPTPRSAEQGIESIFDVLRSR